MDQNGSPVERSEVVKRLQLRLRPCINALACVNNERLVFSSQAVCGGYVVGKSKRVLPSEAGKYAYREILR